MLIVLAGLPGAGKTAVSVSLAREIGAVHVRIDSIEQALRDSAFGKADLGSAGYDVAYAVVADNLRLGHSVIADSVNPIQSTRDAWRKVALDCGVRLREVEVICSDAAEHRRRVESRKSDIETLELPTWHDVVDREYEPWDRERILIDTARASAEDCAGEIAAALG